MTSPAPKNVNAGSRTDELRQLFKLAFPTMITQLLRFLNPSISIMVCGHLSREELDASSLAITLINVLGLSVDTGFATAFDTLFSQAYGSRQRKVLGLILQRALCVVFVMFSVLACLHLNIGPILLLLKQDPLISSLTAEFLLCFLPGLACDFLFLTLGRYLQAQNIVLPMLYSSCLGTVFNVALQYFFVVRLNRGLRTSALCLSCSFAFMLCCVLTYLRATKQFADTWSEVNLNAVLRNWGIIFRMGIPGLFMVALEEWCFEMLTFIAGSMNEVTLGAHAIAFQIQSIIYMVPLGIFTAVNVRVGQKLGAFDPSGARFAYTTALRLIPIIAVCTAGPVLLLRHVLPHVFTEDPDVCQMASRLLPMLLIFQIFEGFAGVSEAVLLACGRQSTGAVIIFCGYYCVGMPLALILAYHTNLGIFGAWFGLASGFGITTLTYGVLAIRTNWIKEARQAYRNIDSQQGTQTDCMYEQQLSTMVPYCDTGENSRFSPTLRDADHSGRENGSCSLVNKPLTKIITPTAFIVTNHPRLGRLCFVRYAPVLSMRTILCTFLVLFWIAALALRFHQPPAVWWTHCQSIHMTRHNRTLPSFCERMSLENSQFPLNFVSFYFSDFTTDTYTERIDSIL